MPVRVPLIGNPFVCGPGTAWRPNHHTTGEFGTEAMLSSRPGRVSSPASAPPPPPQPRLVVASVRRPSRPTKRERVDRLLYVRLTLVWLECGVGEE